MFPSPSSLFISHRELPLPPPRPRAPQAVGVPISTIPLYTACGGCTMPVMIDVGTDNEELPESPFYVGVRHKRVRGDA